MKSTNILKNKKPIIDAIVVVEGKTDSAKLKKLFDVQTIETNGLNLTSNTINMINNISKHKEIILFLDPDGPGEKIRKKLMDNLNNCKQIFITKNDINFNNNKKIGVAEAYDEAIIKAFQHLVIFNKGNNSISWQEYLNLNLNNKIKRKQITDYFYISECNHKQLFKRLNMMNISYNQLKEIIDEKH